METISSQEQIFIFQPASMGNILPRVQVIMRSRASIFLDGKNDLGMSKNPRDIT
jgi:hypothetical protein